MEVVIGVKCHNSSRHHIPLLAWLLQWSFFHHRLCSCNASLHSDCWGLTGLMHVTAFRTKNSCCTSSGAWNHREHFEPMSAATVRRSHVYTRKEPWLTPSKTWCNVTGELHPKPVSSHLAPSNWELVHKACILRWQKKRADGLLFVWFCGTVCWVLLILLYCTYSYLCLYILGFCYTITPACLTRRVQYK